ncbi:MAG: 30S ribosomal protein S3ae [Thaumarchaeota archaeon]|nr:30S ribosomal protein S3ae [Nitrososphaerota archaeon]
MPRAKRGGRVRDKWREKKWKMVEAPTAFGSTLLAQIPISDDEGAVGRVIETTLYDLVKQDPQQYSIKLYFEISKIVGDKVQTILKGYEYSREYLRSLIRRGSSMVDMVEDFETKDKVKIRVYLLALSTNRLNASKKRKIKEIAIEILIQKTKNLTYYQIAQEAVLGKVASDIYNEAKKIVQIRHIGIRKMKILGVPENLEESAEGDMPMQAKPAEGDMPMQAKPAE